MTRRRMFGKSMRPILSGGLLVAAVLGGAVSASVLSAIDPVQAPDDGDRYSTWIESYAAGAFDPSTPQLRSLRVTYRVDARVLLPLGFTSLGIWSRLDVGTAVASYRDCAAGPDDVLRAYELFSTSRPERARGFDRRGLFREAVRLTGRGASWAAYFRAMTSWPEKTLAEARKSADGPQPHAYEAIDGLSSPLGTQSSVFHVASDRVPAGPADLWAAVRPLLSVLPPHRVESQNGSQAKPLPSLAFVGACRPLCGLRRCSVRSRCPPRPSAWRSRTTGSCGSSS